jgi:hypothetical protein
MNDMVSIRKMRFGAEDAGDVAVDSGCADFVLGGKVVV